MIRELAHNRERRIMQTMPNHNHMFEPSAAAPKGEAPHNKRARLRQVGVSRTGVGIKRILERMKEKRNGR
jgi:hypothetical protein